MSKKLFSILTLLASLMMFAVTTNADTINLEWIVSSYSVSMRDHEGNLLPEGARVDVVIANDGVVHAINAPTFSLTGGDTLLFSLVINDDVGGLFVQHYIPPDDVYLEDLSFDESLLSVPLYARFFNVADPVASFNNNETVSWGETGIINITWNAGISGYELILLPDAEVDVLATNVVYGQSVAVPEPLSIITLLFGIAGIRFWKRKR